jgi:hypothetical protein
VDVAGELHARISAEQDTAAHARRRLCFRIDSETVCPPVRCAANIPARVFLLLPLPCLQALDTMLRAGSRRPQKTLACNMISRHSALRLLNSATRTSGVAMSWLKPGLFFRQCHFT